MTTASWTTVVDHTSTAGFRTWGSELSAKLASVGMVQTADTGQINWTTVTLPGTSTVGGYEIWKLSGGALYFKLEYGSGSGSNSPAITYTVGTGSNGSGTLTGQLCTRTQSNLLGTLNTTSTYQSFLCATASFFGLAWKVGAISAYPASAVSSVCVGQTVDSTGAASSTGYYVVIGAQTNTNSIRVATLQTVRTAATAATRSQGSYFSLVPGVPSASTDGTNNQAYLHWLDTPAVQPALHTCSIRANELTLGSTFSATLVGSTAHTYIGVSAIISGSYLTYDASGNTNLAMLWE